MAKIIAKKKRKKCEPACKPQDLKWEQLPEGGSMSTCKKCKHKTKYLSSNHSAELTKLADKNKQNAEKKNRKNNFVKKRTPKNSPPVKERNLSAIL